MKPANTYSDWRRSQPADALTQAFAAVFVVIVVVCAVCGGWPHVVEMFGGER